MSPSNTTDTPTGDRSQLSERQVEAVQAIEDEGLSRREAADRLGITEGAFGNLYNKALRTMGRESEIGGSGNSAGGSRSNPLAVFERALAEIDRRVEAAKTRASEARAALKRFDDDDEVKKIVAEAKQQATANVEAARTAQREVEASVEAQRAGLRAGMEATRAALPEPEPVEGEPVESAS